MVAFYRLANEPDMGEAHMKWFWRSVILLIALLTVGISAYVGGEVWVQHARTREFDRLIRERQELREKSAAQAAQAYVPDDSAQP